MQEYDPEFQKLFKLVAEFDYEIDRTEQSEADVARLIVIKARESGLLPFDRSGLEELVDYAARLSGDQNKLSLQFNKLFELVVESSAWAKKAGSKKVYRRQVIHAFDEKRRRSALLEEKIRGGFMENLVRIDTTGEAVGQINGLAVVSFADVAFGHPSRITANTFMGPGGVVNIERETNMAGPIHNKGVLTLSSYFGRIYAQKMPINFTARIAFEQQYGGIDGDSASSTELYCLLSSLADLPIRQEVAVTGSVDQLGNVQPIGGVNEKIEGFFDYCQAKGLTGSQGVMIPWQNEQHLMLSHRVADAISKGIFHVWTVQTIDEGIELLTGVPAGSPDSRGNYPASSVHGRVFARLKEWHKQALKLAGGSSHPAAKKKGTKNARRGRAE
ncbi:AAA domain protein [Jonquetella sp. BV3C21]|nr:AAA domain protein [Jonquetella sp. BV3C21]